MRNIPAIAKLSRWANKHEWVLVLVTIMIFLRLPSLFEPFWYGDENIYLAIGQALRRGAVLYQEITDYPNKPPMIYWLASIAGNVSWFRFMLLLWSIPGVVFFYKLIQLVTKNQTISFFAGLAFVYLTATPILEGTIANAEIFFIVPTILAAWLLYPRENNPNQTARIHFLGGLCMGMAFLFKIHVLLDIAFLGLFLYVFPYTSRLSQFSQMVVNRKVWAFVLGVSVPIVTSLFLLGVQGVRPQSLVANAASSTGYTSVWNAQDWIAQTVGMGSLPARVLGLSILLMLIFSLKNRLSRPAVFVSLWIVMSLFAALLSARPYPHYLLQTVPAIVLAASLFFSRRKWLDYSVVALLLFLVGAAFVRFDFYLWPVKTYYQNFASYSVGRIDQMEYFRRFDRRMPRNYLLAQIIQQYSSIDKPIYIWGTEPGVYVMSRRTQVGPLVVSFHVEDLDYYDETMTEIEQVQPEIIVIMETEWRQFPELETYLGKHYLLVEKVGDPLADLSSNQGFRALVYKRAKFL